MRAKRHWDEIHSTRELESVSWFERRAELSLRLIHDSGVSNSAPIIDVGAGASLLVDDLLAQGYENVSVLDISSNALSIVKARLGSLADSVDWIEADVTQLSLPADAYELWHDRAVFHFLTASKDREAYVRATLRSLRPGGHLVIATFAADGPTQCSGLPVVRYTAGELAAVFGSSFTLVDEETSEHHTPSGAAQKFIYCRFQMK